MKARAHIIWIYPFDNPLSRGSGGNNRVYELILALANSVNVVLLVPSNKDIQNEVRYIPGVTLKTFNPYYVRKIGNVGIALLEINPSYLINLIKTVKHMPINALVFSFPKDIVSMLVLKPRLKNGYIVYDAHNVEKDRISQEAISENENKLGIFKLFSKLRTSVYEYIVVKASDIIISISYEDKKKFTKMYEVPPEKIIVIPLTINVKRRIRLTKKDTRGNIKLVFHGLYSYIPNKEAIILLKEYIGPKLFNEYTNIEVATVGKNMPKFSSERFTSLGFIEDLYGFLSSCDIAVVPLRRGGGVKIKMLDYMAVGLPIVTTKKGAEGLGLVNGKHAIIVDDVNEEFVGAVKYLIENPKARRKLGHNARKLLEKKYLRKEDNKNIMRIFRYVLTNG